MPSRKQLPENQIDQDTLDQQPEPDSKTNVYTTVPMGRVPVSIRVRPEIKEALNRFCTANGLSICHVFEGLVTAYLYGVNQQIDFVNKSPTIELTVVRDVKRVRRYVREVDGGGRDIFIEDVGGAAHCARCDELPVFQAVHWVDRFHCVRFWLCKAHFVKKEWIVEGRGWRWLGEPGHE